MVRFLWFLFFSCGVSRLCCISIRVSSIVRNVVVFMMNI